MRDEGGPAFPNTLIETKDGAITSGFEGYGLGGMSMRDYFAAKAMQAEMITTFSDATPDSAQEFVSVANRRGRTLFQHLACNAYEVADAMIAERNKP